MSRDAVATSASTSTTKLWHLVARPNTASLIVSSDDYPDSSVAILPEDLRTFRVIWHWLQMCGSGNLLFRGKRPTSESAQKIPYSVLIVLLNFINPVVASFLMRQLAKGVSISQNIPLTQIAQIPQLSSVQPVYNETISLFNVTAFSFFDYHADNLSCLLNASLNADLKTVKRIFEKTHPDTLRRLLSTKDGKATTVLGRITVERTGTPLQMAIYDHDEEMVAFFKEKMKMDPAEFQRQCEKVIGTDYDAFLQNQEVEATEICANLEKAFESAPPAAFTVNGNYVASTTSKELPGTINDFINGLADYCQKNHVHNPYILQRVNEIYCRLPPYFSRDCFFSQKVIGGVQSFLSARWLQHYAQGIDYLAESNEVPCRSFICRDSSPHIDIRHLVGSCIGSDAFLSVRGAQVSGGRWLGGRTWLVGALQKLCRTKTASLQNFMPRTHCCSIQ